MAETPIPETPIIVWFRQDLRVADNPALAEAAKSKRPIIPLYILDDDTPGHWRIGGAGRWFLHHAVESLNESLAKLGAPLLLKRGRAGKIIPALIKETGASAIYWNRTYEPFAVARDKELKQSLGIEAKSFQASLLFEPWTVQTKTGEPYKVFTPFWRACRAAPEPRAPLAKPKKFAGFGGDTKSDALASWALLPTKPNWASAFSKSWRPAKPAHRNHWIILLMRRSAIMPKDAICSAKPTPRIFRRICIGAASVRFRFGPGWRMKASRITRSLPKSRNSSPKSAGANSRTIFCIIGPICQKKPGAKNSTPCLGATMPRKSKPGAEEKPGFPSSMRRCANCGPPATCTIARA